LRKKKVSTHSFIGIEDETTGKIKGIYCHYDGYPDGVGYELKTHYRDEDKIRSLVALGSISALRAHLGDKHAFADLDAATSHQWTTAYHRDRGEELVISEYDDLYSIDNGGGYQYAYVYTRGCWLYKSYEQRSAWLPLL